MLVCAWWFWFGVSGAGRCGVLVLMHVLTVIVPCWRLGLDSDLCWVLALWFGFCCWFDCWIGYDFLIVALRAVVFFGCLRLVTFCVGSGCGLWFG